MKHSLCYLMVAVLFLCIVGCTNLDNSQQRKTVVPAVQRPQVDTPVTPSRGNEAIHGTTEFPSKVTTISETLEDKPRVFFMALASNGFEADFCRKVADECAQQLLPKHARVVTVPKADMTVVLDAEFKEIDAFGEYVRMECKECRAKILDIRKDELSSLIVVRPRALPRQLGRDEAVNQYVLPASRELVPRLRDEIDRLANENICVEEVTFLVKCVPFLNATRTFQREIQHIKAILNDERDILSWELLSQDAGNQRCRFRIVYKKGGFPEGLSNKLGSKL